MFGFRKARKSSPDPADRYNGSDPDPAVTPQSTPQGRRRIKQLPQATPPSARKRSHALPLYQTPGSATCNHFLLGGHYYPGKDKKAKHLRKRTLWHRMFCSSSWRMILSTIFITYIVLWRVLVPTLDVVLDYGKMLAGQRSGTAGMNLLPPVDQQRDEMDKVKQIKDEFRGASRLKILEKIVPEFYHRNDETKKERIKDETKGRIEDEPHVPKSSVEQKLTPDHEDRHESSQHHQKDAKKRKPLKDLIDNGESNKEEKRKKTVDDPKKQPVNQEDKSKLRSEQELKDNVKKHEKPKQISDHKEPENRQEKSKKAAVEEEKKDSENQDSSATKEQAEKHVKGQDEPQPKEGKASDAKIKHDEIKAYDNSHHELPPGMREHGVSTQRTLHTMDEFPNQSHCPGSITSLNTTLLLQCSLDRMWILQETCHRWQDPIVVVVHLTSDDHSFDEWKTSCPQMTIIPYVAGTDEKESHYPINRLRNIGLDVVQTSHVVVVDVDFVPSQGLDQKIRSVLKERLRQVEDAQVADRDAIVIPAFERVVEDCSTSDCSQFLKTNSSFLPKTKEELQSCMQSQNCAVFQSKNNWEGHYSTQSHKWLNGEYYQFQQVTLADNSTSKIIKQVPCFDSMRYEPYVVIRWCAAEKQPVAPYYDERFYGYGKNKIQMISHLRFLAYQFSILPKGFIIHNPHEESKAKKVWNDVQDYKLHETMDALYPQFLEELYDKYRNVTDPRSIVQQCKHNKEKKKRS